MSDVPGHGLEDRILLLAPTLRDAEAATRLFASEGLALTICRELGEVCAEILRGAAAAIVPDEAIRKDQDASLARILNDQPGWSDLPLIVLMTPSLGSEAAHELEALGPLTLVRRPIEIRSFLSTVRAALRDRRRQYARREDLAERERQAQILRDNDRHKDEFLAMLAHELRNPLAAVNNAVKVLKLASDDESRDWAGLVVERQVKQLVHLIDDLLDVSRITSGKIRLRMEHVDAARILDNAIESARPLIDARNQTLNVVVECGGLPIHADPTRVEQIVLNLLSNAAKYTDTGGTILLTGGREGDRVAIRVKDNGMGIPPEKLPEMFRLFSQGDRTLARSEGGLGIGLTIVKKLTEMHGGSIESWSDGLGQGSEFTVRLPRDPDPIPTEARPMGHTARENGPVRVLVVDDSVDTARGVVRILKHLGNEVIAVHDGNAALVAARTLQPQYVLLDIGLPGMNGYEVAAHLREDDQLKDAVIIAISGYGQDEDRRRSRAAGIDHHLVKPVDFDALLAYMKQPSGAARL